MSSAASISAPTYRSTARPLLVRRAAVLGAGTMGSRIAAHLANAGIPTLMLDIPPKEGAAMPAKAALERWPSRNPRRFSTPEPRG